MHEKNAGFLDDGCRMHYPRFLQIPNDISDHGDDSMSFSLMRKAGSAEIWDSWVE
jgi:hypothetical protein